MDAWNPSLDAAEQIMGTAFQHKGTDYKAVSIEPVTFEQRSTPGGKFSNATVTVMVRKIFSDAAGMAVIGQILMVRGQRVRVQEFDDDGDNSVLLICGPAGVEMPNR